MLNKKYTISEIEEENRKYFLLSISYSKLYVPSIFVPISLKVSSSFPLNGIQASMPSMGDWVKNFRTVLRACTGRWFDHF